jgi:hypothetical protein
MDDIATKIVTIPRRMYSEDKSPFALLKGTGYFAVHGQVSVSDIREAVADDPECVGEWFQYVEDKRSSSGWYVGPNEEGLFEVGFYDSAAEPNRSSRMQYETAIDACAAFIKQEIEDIRSGK